MTCKEIMQALCDNKMIVFKVFKLKLDEAGNLMKSDNADVMNRWTRCTSYYNFNGIDEDMREYKIQDEYDLSFEEAFRRMFLYDKHIQSSASPGHVFYRGENNKVMCTCGKDVILGLGDYEAMYKIVE